MRQGLRPVHPPEESAEAAFLGNRLELAELGRALRVRVETAVDDARPGPAGVGAAAGFEEAAGFAEGVAGGLLEFVEALGLEEGFVALGLQAGRVAGRARRGRCEREGGVARQRVARRSEDGLAHLLGLGAQEDVRSGGR